MGRLVLTPEMLAAAYDYLQTTPPFCSWNLPESEDITFKTMRHKINAADWSRDGGRHIIRVNLWHTTTDALMMRLAHEMIHAHEDHNSCGTRGEHSAAFKEWAREVCALHGWDTGLF